MNRGQATAWADVTEGQTLPALTFPVTYSTLAKDVAGTRDIYRVHHDPDFARSTGARHIFLNTMWYQGLIGRFITDWAGPESFLRKLSIAMNVPGCPGDVLTVHGTVTRVYPGDAGMGLADVAVRIDNQTQGGVVTAQVTVEIP